jgi:hypothetical protein
MKIKMSSAINHQRLRGVCCLRRSIRQRLQRRQAQAIWRKIQNEWLQAAVSIDDGL